MSLFNGSSFNGNLFRQAPDRQRHDTNRRQPNRCVAWIALVTAALFSLGACASDGTISAPDLGSDGAALTTGDDGGGGDTSTDTGGDTSTDAGGDTSTDAGGDTSTDTGGDTSTDAGGDTSTDGGGDTSTDTSGGDTSSNPAAEPTDDGTNPVVLLGIIGLFALGFAWVASLSGNSKADAQSSASNARARQQLDEVLTTARWADDQATQLLAVKDPSQLGAVAPSLQEHFDRGKNLIAALGSQVTDPDLSEALSNLGRGLASLRGLMVSYIHAATDGADTHDLQTLRSGIDSRRLSVESAIDRVSNYSSALYR